MVFWKLTFDRKSPSAAKTLQGSLFMIYDASNLCLRILPIGRVLKIIFAIADDLILLKILPGMLQRSAVLTLTLYEN